MATAGHWMVGPGRHRPHIGRAGYGAEEKERTHWNSLAPVRACHALVFRTSLPQPPCHLVCHLQVPLLANEGEGDSGKSQTSPNDYQMIQRKEKHPLSLAPRLVSLFHTLNSGAWSALWVPFYLSPNCQDFLCTPPDFS